MYPDAVIIRGIINEEKAERYVLTCIIFMQFFTSCLITLYALYMYFELVSIRINIICLMGPKNLFLVVFSNNSRKKASAKCGCCIFDTCYDDSYLTSIYHLIFTSDIPFQEPVIIPSYNVLNNMYRLPADIKNAHLGFYDRCSL